jgi:hypothetical protein
MLNPTAKLVPTPTNILDDILSAVKRLESARL